MLFVVHGGCGGFCVGGAPIARVVDGFLLLSGVLLLVPAVLPRVGGRLSMNCWISVRIGCVVSLCMLL